MDNRSSVRQALWACPRCHTLLPAHSLHPEGTTYPLTDDFRGVEVSASLALYDAVCPNCGLPYTATKGKRFEYPYRQLLAATGRRRFLRWSAAQNNGYVSYGLMRGASCSIEGREDVADFAAFISKSLSADPAVLLDLGCGPLSRPAYIPPFPNSSLIGVDPFESQWSGRFIQGAGEFLPLPDDSVDVVVTATALDHMLDLSLALSELARVTRTGGKLVVWDHTFPPRGRVIWNTLVPVLSPRYPVSTKVRVLRAAFPERVRLYDNGVVMWTPKGHADPFHTPDSRRPSWAKKLRTAIERAGFTQVSTDLARGFSHYVRILGSESA